MYFFLYAYFLANASVSTHTTTRIQGEGSTYTYVESTINGNSTTVESNNPGEIRVKKTDTEETIISDKPVSVTHSNDAGTTPTPTITTDKIRQKSTLTTQEIMNPPNWITFIRSLWDHIKSAVFFGVLTKK
jgi:hypothetical protein